MHRAAGQTGRFFCAGQVFMIKYLHAQIHVSKRKQIRF